MRLYSFRYIIPQAFKSLKLNGWMTFASIMTISITLFLCAISWLLVVNIDANAQQMESDVRVSAYISQSISSEDYSALKKEIEAIDGVDQVEFVSKAQGLSDLEKRFGGVNLEDTLGGNNPLPDRFSISAVNKDSVNSVAKAVKKLTGIDTVRYGEGSVEKLFALTDTVRKVGITLIILLGIAAITLVAMTIRLTVFARRKEIMVMKWVGATNAFIRLPFLLEGVILGVIGALIAVVLVFICYNYAGAYVAGTISFVYLLKLGDIWLNILGFAVLAGLLMGAFGSFISLIKGLDV